MSAGDAPATRNARLDAHSRGWVDRLSQDSPEREEALAALHALLLKAARFEVGRRARAFPQLRGDDHEDLAQQSADDALVAVLGKLDDFRGDSRFTTWAYKFALFEAGTKVRRRAWQGREVSLDPEMLALCTSPRPRPGPTSIIRGHLARDAPDQEIWHRPELPLRSVCIDAA